MFNFNVKVIFIILCIAVLSINITLYCIAGKTEYEVKRQFKYGFTIRNKTNKLVSDSEFWVFAPVKRTANQLCKTIKTTHPYDLLTDNLGNQVLYFKLDSLPPFATQIINIKAEVYFAQKPNSYKSTDPELFLKTQRYIEVDSPEIISKANDFSGSGDLKTAERINTWLFENIKYAGYISNPRGALYTLREKQGDCTEFTHLFIALCRVNDIPSRGIGGYICSESRILKAAEYHNWAEFYQGRSWQIADPQNKIFKDKQTDYVAMKIDGPETDDPSFSFNRFKIDNSALTVEMN